MTFGRSIDDRGRDRYRIRDRFQFSIYKGKKKVLRSETVVPTLDLNVQGNRSPVNRVKTRRETEVGEFDVFGVCVCTQSLRGFFTETTHRITFRKIRSPC